MKYPRTLLAMLTGIIWTLTSGTAWAMNMVVFESQGGALQPGQVVDASQPLTLTEGQSISLISDAGQVVRLQGPYAQAPLSADANQAGGVKDALAHLMSASGSESSSFGVARSADDVFKMAGEQKWLPDPWLINATEAGDQCHRAGTPVVFWRPDSSNEVGVQIRIGKEDKLWQAQARWAGGKSKLATPPSIPQQDGAVYNIQLDEAEVSTTVHLIPEAVTAEPAVAAWMREKGCKNQSLAMIKNLQK